MKIIAKFDHKTDAEEAFAALLAGGVAPSDMSLVVPVEIEGPLRQIDLSNGHLMDAPDAGFIDPAGEAGFIGRGMGSPRISAEGSMVLESEVGGGISTSTPADDVSYVEELDDSQSAAERMLYPDSGESFGGQDAHDIERFANTGSLDLIGIGQDGIAGSSRAEDNALASLYQDLSVIVLPHFGLVYGDGMLATELTAIAFQSQGARDPSPEMNPILYQLGADHNWADQLASCWKQGGALLEVTLPPEEIEAFHVERIVGMHGGKLPETREV